MSKRRAKLSLIMIVFIISALFSGMKAVENKATKITSKDMIYFLMTDRFYDGDENNDYGVVKGELSQYNGGDFQGVIDKLDYIKNLGFTAIWISPVVKNDQGGYHGYWATDFYKTNENFGTMDKLKELVNKAHQKGIKVLFDIVLNHTGKGHPFVDNPDYPNWFHPKQDISDYNNQQQVENGWLAGLPDFNTENPDVRKYLIDMAKWWITQTGIDGYRIDTVRHIPKDFWVEFSSEIKKSFPDFYMIGEVFDNNPIVVGDYQNTGITGLLDFPTYNLAKDVFKGDVSAIALADLIKQEGADYKNRSLMGTFIDNHDVSRFVNQIYSSKNEKLEAALTFMMTYTGIPILYYGTEIGMDGGADPDNRRMMDFSVKSPITSYVKKLTALRKNNPALYNGSIELLSATDTFLSYTRTCKGNTVITAFNTLEGAKRYEYKIPAKYLKGATQLKDEITSKVFKIKNGRAVLDLKPCQACVFIIK